MAGAGERVVAIVDAMKCEKMRQKALEGAELGRIDEFEMGEGAVGLSGAELVEETHWRLGGVGEGHGMTVEHDGVEPAISMTAQGAAVGESHVDDFCVVIANAEVLAPAYRIEELVGGTVAVDDKGGMRKRKSRRLRPLHGSLKCASSGKDDLSFVASIVVGRVANFERMDIKHDGTCFVVTGQ